MCSIRSIDLTSCGVFEPTAYCVSGDAESIKINKLDINCQATFSSIIDGKLSLGFLSVKSSDCNGLDPTPRPLPFLFSFSVKLTDVWRPAQTVMRGSDVTSVFVCLL